MNLTVKQFSLKKSLKMSFNSVFNSVLRFQDLKIKANLALKI